ncbi:MAG: helix-turn-helix domain-containing protein [candidate division Zixibacteria bacterium]|nr:helix-turn-helix domain-containing protein [candidate division Zixibacteria bacterium]
MLSQEEFKPRRLVSVREAAALLGLSGKTLYNRINEGILPLFKLSRSVRISVADLERYVERCRVQKCAQ